MDRLPADANAPSLGKQREEPLPNILYIMADQMNAPLLPIYNKDSVIKMPHLKALADQAVVFDNAYTNSPLCAPSRFSMVSGRLPGKIQAYDNASTLASDVPTYAHYLRLLGYHTALAGKQHFVGPDQLHGYEERLTSDIYPADFGWTVDWRHDTVRADWYHNMSSVEEAGPCFTSNQLDYDEEVSYQANRYLWQRARHNRDQPFCLTVSFTSPHDPYAARQEFWDMYEDVEIPLPKNTIPHDKQDPHSQRLLRVIDLHGKTMTDDQIKRARRAYFANCTYVDSKIGKLVQTLRESGMLENTIIVFSGDHGDALGERGLWYKMNYFEGAARVPMLFHSPQRWQTRRVQEVVSTMDMLPTFVEMVGGNIDPYISIEGRSMFPHLENTGGHDECLGEYYGEGTISPLFMIRRGPWKFIYCDRDPSQLFNLVEDPDELTNLCASEKHIQLVNQFHDEVKLRWDVDRLRKDVLESQAKRRLVASALRVGHITSWDHQPRQDASKQYVRNNAEVLDDVEYLARWPRVA